MLEITNYNTRPAIRMTAAQENECVRIQKKLMDYLLQQKERSEIRDLPFGLRKYAEVLRHWIKSGLRIAPALDKVIRGGYAALKLRALGVVFVKNQ